MLTDPTDSTTPGTLPLPVEGGVAFQGEPGAYSEEMIEQMWHGDATPVPVETFESVVRAVLDGTVEYGVLPIWNSVVGAIAATQELLRSTPELVSLMEIAIPVRHALLAPEGATLESVTSAASHPVALAQCGAFLRRHPRITARISHDTAGAAREIAARGRHDEAAIASVRAARRYRLAILAEDIQDSPDNETRFIVIARAGTQTPGSRPAPTPPSTSMPTPTPTPSPSLPRVRALRGAITVARDEPALVHEATRVLLTELLARNALTHHAVISAFFTATADLRSDFPARAARDLGWTEVPMLCSVEMSVPSSVTPCIRVLLHVELPGDHPPVQHAYLRGAAALRPDLDGTR